MSSTRDAYVINQRSDFAGNTLLLYSRLQPPITHSVIDACIYYALSLGTFQVIIAGGPAAAETQALISAAQRSFCPNLVLIVEDGAARTTTGNDGGDNKQQEQAPEEGVKREAPPLFRDVLDANGLGGYVPGEDGRAAAYVCFDNACSRPVNTAEGLEELL